MKKEKEEIRRFNNLDMDYNLGFFRISNGILIGLGDIEGFVGSEKETFAWLSAQFENDKKALEALSSNGYNSLPENLNGMETPFDQPFRLK